MIYGFISVLMAATKWSYATLHAFFISGPHISPTASFIVSSNAYFVTCSFFICFLVSNFLILVIELNKLKIYIQRETDLKMFVDDAVFGVNGTHFLEAGVSDHNFPCFPQLNCSFTRLPKYSSNFFFLINTVLSKLSNWWKKLKKMGNYYHDKYSLGMWLQFRVLLQWNIWIPQKWENLLSWWCNLKYPNSKINNWLN